ASVPRQECDGASLQLSENIDIRRRPEWSFHSDFAALRESGHLVKPAAANDADLRLLHSVLLWSKCESGIIQNTSEPFASGLGASSEAVILSEGGLPARTHQRGKPEPKDLGVVW